MRKSLIMLALIAILTVTLIGGIGKQAESSPLPKVGVVTTGGTIAMKYDPAKKGFVPAVSGEDLIAMAPKLRELARIELVDIARIPSSHMDPPMWIKVLKSVEKLLSDPEVAGAVITHGTDTLEETAHGAWGQAIVFLAFFHQIPFYDFRFFG